MSLYFMCDVKFEKRMIHEAPLTNNSLQVRFISPDLKNSLVEDGDEDAESGGYDALEHLKNIDNEK